MVRSLIPPPTKQDIEASLTAIRNGTSAIQQWRAGGCFKAHDLWWVTIIFDERHFPIGVGTTSAEAAAVAWITCVLPDLSDEDYAKVPRHVPDDVQFELHAVPALDATLS